MIKIENTEVVGWKHAIRGARNPMNSWDKSDSDFTDRGSWYPFIGENDLDLMKRLVNAGTDHSKFMRMITVYADITAPAYWVAEHDTYKVSTVRNSCSFMHKGVSKPFEITDFSVADERIYQVLSPIQSKHYQLTYPYETNEYREYVAQNGRKYKVFSNGRVFRCEFTYTDNYGTGRTRKFEECEVKPSETASGYYEIHIGGRSGEKWLLHRLVAHVWNDNPELRETVNHKNGNKGDNSAENLEWLCLSDNIKEGFACGLYDNNKLHCNYIKWKRGHKTATPDIKARVVSDHFKGLTPSEISDKYNLPKKYINNAIFCPKCEDSDLFCQCYIWETIIDNLNCLRQEYLDTKDEAIFQAIRQLLPQGYNIRYTWSANYQVLRNIYHSRKNHRLPEWHTFCEWIETLPYSELITGSEVREENV